MYNLIFFVFCICYYRVLYCFKMASKQLHCNSHDRVLSAICSGFAQNIQLKNVTPLSLQFSPLAKFVCSHQYKGGLLNLFLVYHKRTLSSPV